MKYLHFAKFATVSVITLRVTITRTFYSKRCANCVATCVTWCVSSDYPFVNICRMDKQRTKGGCPCQQDEVKSIRIKQNIFEARI